MLDYYVYFWLRYDGLPYYVGKGKNTISIEQQQKMQQDRIPWNKGKKLGPNPEHSARLKGRTPWNKGLSMKKLTNKEVN
jgi:hypothetical protein